MNIKRIIQLTAVFLFSILLSNCVKKDIDPFNPVYDLGLVAATEADLKDASSILPNYHTGALPVSSILNMPPIQDQKKQGSCIGFSAGYAVMSYYINRSLNGNYSTIHTASPKFLYNLSKLGSDCGSGSIYPRALAVLKDKGICTWSEMPYNDVECSTQPNSIQLSSASKYKIKSWTYIMLSNTDMMKRLIYSGYPLMVGITVYDNLFSYKGGVYNSISGKKQGGHAVCIIGYNESTRAFKVQNSWSSAWGESGSFWVSYDFLAQQLAMEKWCYVAVPNF